MYLKNFNEYLIDINSSFQDALFQLNNLEFKFLVVLENEKVKGTLTDGDIRRVLLDNSKTSSKIKDFLKEDFIFATSEENPTDAIKRVVNKGSFFLPVLDSKKQLVAVQIVDKETKFKRTDYESNVLIMAGGFGRRLSPITDETPKPMIQLGDYKIIEHILFKLKDEGFKKIFISVHYLKDKIIDHIGNGEKYGLQVEYLIEDQPLGTAGVLSLLPEIKNELLMINADILMSDSFSGIVEYFYDNDYDLILGVREYITSIPFGVINSNNDVVNNIEEKPSIVSHISCGINLLHHELVNTISEVVLKDFPELVNEFADSKRIGTFEFSGYWHDIGSISELEIAKKRFERN